MDSEKELQPCKVPDLLLPQARIVFFGELACLGPRFIVYNNHAHPGQNTNQFEMLEGELPDQTAKLLENTMNGAEVTVTIEKIPRG